MLALQAEFRQASRLRAEELSLDTQQKVSEQRLATELVVAKKSADTASERQLYEAQQKLRREEEEAQERTAEQIKPTRRPLRCDPPSVSRRRVGSGKLRPPALALFAVLPDAIVRADAAAAAVLAEAPDAIEFPPRKSHLQTTVCPCF